jgi:hypothetical protein
MEHATVPAGIVLGLFSLLIIAMILGAQKGRELYIRPIPGLTAIEEAIGRATEMGRPILASLGLGGIDVVTLQGLAIVTSVVQKAASYGNRVLLPVADSTLLPVAEDAVREAYVSAGRSESFHAEDVMFLTDRQFAYAAGVAGMINREQVASMFMFGYFYAEALIMAENGNRIGAIQVVGTPSTTQIPFFIAACDYVIIGDEYYAATAYLTGEPTLRGSLVGQDIAKGILIALIVAGVLLVTLGSPLLLNFFQDKPMSLPQMLRTPVGGGG